MKFPTLYGKNSSGKLKIWEVFTEDNRITVRHGMLGSDRIQSQHTLCEAKNVGKANETSPSQQAQLEAQAKWVKQKKKGYFESKEDALGFCDFAPMKAHNFNAHAHRVEYPCIVQAKLDGRRLMIDKQGRAISKQGEQNEVPEHWKDDILKLKEADLLEKGLDGEVFAGYKKQGGLSLQQINSAFLKPNENTQLLKFYIYDIPDQNQHQCTRDELIGRIVEFCEQNGIETIKAVDTFVAHNEYEGDEWYKHCLEQGAEGVVYRKVDGLYEFGKKSYNLIKRKPRQDAEALVISSKPDKNGQGLLSCRLENGIEFDCLMRKDSDSTTNYRLAENSASLVGKWITFQYEELSDSGVPLKSVGTGVRRMDNNWQPLE